MRKLKLWWKQYFCKHPNLKWKWAFNRGWKSHCDEWQEATCEHCGKEFERYD